MASTVTETPVVLRAAHVSGLHAINKEMSDMHHAMLRTAGDESRAVRLSVLTLVIACVDQQAAEFAVEAVRRIAATHPARAIILVANRRGDSRIEADLSLECTSGKDAQVCAEVVHLNVYGESALHISSIVRPLLLSDVPVYLWLAGPTPLHYTLAEDALRLCERVIFDSEMYREPLEALNMVANTVAGEALPIVDMAWARIQPWRELIAHAFDSHDMRPFLSGTKEVIVEATAIERSSQAWLLAGWLTIQLQRYRAVQPKILVREANNPEIFVGAVAKVKLICAYESNTANVTVLRERDTMVTNIEVDDGMTASSASSVEDRDTIDIVGSQIEEIETDPVFAAALQQAALLNKSSGDKKPILSLVGDNGSQNQGVHTGAKSNHNAKSKTKPN